MSGVKRIVEIFAPSGRIICDTAEPSRTANQPPQSIIRTLHRPSDSSALSGKIADQSTGQNTFQMITVSITKNEEK